MKEYKLEIQIGAMRRVIEEAEKRYNELKKNYDTDSESREKLNKKVQETSEEARRYRECLNMTVEDVLIKDQLYRIDERKI